MNRYTKYATFFFVPSLIFYKISNKEVYSKEIENQNLVDKKFLVNDKLKIKDSKLECKKIVEVFRVLSKTPGVVVGVSFKGKKLWTLANGLADIETKTFCTEDTVMRIGSISKPMAVLYLAKLYEDNKVDLKKPINDYLGNKYPVKYYNNEKVDITLEQLLSHMAGIRHYKIHQEALLNEKFSIYDSLKIFKDDDLLSKPGEKFLYTSYGYVLISAVIDSILEKNNKSFSVEFLKMLNEQLKMNSTYIDVNETIIPNRCKYYRSNKGKLENVPEVNNVYKVASGGLISNVEDLLKFGNCMLFSYKGEGILKKETVKLLWNPNEKSKEIDIYGHKFNYGMGWYVSSKKESMIKGLEKDYLNEAVFHLGQSVGSKSILIIFPKEEIVIAVITNSNNEMKLGKLAYDIAEQVCRSLKNLNMLN